MPPEIASITLYSDESAIAGFEICYRSNGINTPPVRHMGSGSQGRNLRNAVLNLAPGEFITEITGRAGNIIDFIKISTSYGQKIELGGYGGNPFGNLVNAGSRIVGFGGGINGHLHNLYAYLVWV